MKKEIFFVAFIGLVGYSLQSSLFKHEKEYRPGRTKYIIGYDTLINDEFKAKTYPHAGNSIPVRVNGFKRTRTVRNITNCTLSPTFLAVQEDPENFINGVIFSVADDTVIFRYEDDENESSKRLYFRVPWDNISIVRGSTSDNGTFPSEEDLKVSEFWINNSIPAYSKNPNERFAIVRNYVDIFLSGCVQMERKYGLGNFIEECVTQTKVWEYPWVNDKIHLRRSWQYQAEAWHIDRLIQKQIPGYGLRISWEKKNQGRGDCSGGNKILSVLCPLYITAVSSILKVLIIGQHK